MAYQKIIIQGNVGQVHEPKYTQSGDMVLGFSVAYSEGKEKPTTWFNCTAFKKTAEVVQKYVHKGDAVLVEGRIKCEKYTSKEGVEKEAWKVDVDKVVLLNNKRDDAPHEPAKVTHTPTGAPVDSFDDDLPFFEPCRHYNLWMVM
jgi:single-strand DNA-binding protein